MWEVFYKYCAASGQPFRTTSIMIEAKDPIEARQKAETVLKNANYKWAIIKRVQQL